MRLSSATSGLTFCERLIKTGHFQGPLFILFDYEYNNGRSHQHFGKSARNAQGGFLGQITGIKLETLKPTWAHLNQVLPFCMISWKPKKSLPKPNIALVFLQLKTLQLLKLSVQLNFVKK